MLDDSNCDLSCFIKQLVIIPMWINLVQFFGAVVVKSHAEGLCNEHSGLESSSQIPGRKAKVCRGFKALRILIKREIMLMANLGEFKQSIFSCAEGVTLIFAYSINDGTVMIMCLPVQLKSIIISLHPVRHIVSVWRHYY